MIMKKTNLNEAKDFGYVSPAIESCELILESAVLSASTTGNTEGYKFNQMDDDFWM